ncbi:hypothetical protein AX15_005111 [Amanita polypyramis BW_CC]|nr:hypothetical protein AX15_005111 [Amanita polypyramis BW_CC]
MSTLQSPSKKRKHDAISKDSGVAFKLSSATPGKIGPVLGITHDHRLTLPGLNLLQVNYPALEAPPSTPFRCYARKKVKKASTAQDSDKIPDVEDILVVGETDSVEFVSNQDESKKAAQAGCRYLVSVYDRTTGQITVLPATKTPYILTRTVKALKSIPPAAAPSVLAYKEARTTLGETFGTKKAKTAIRAEERNHIDVSAMEGVMDFVMEGIERGSGGLMTQDEAKETADKNRLIPPYSATATEPEDIYPLHEIIPETEWKALSVSTLEQATSEKDRIILLPYRHSEWINGHVERLMEESGKGRRKKLKLLIYISAMFMFYKIAQSKRIEKDKLNAKMTGISDLIIDSLTRRFSEVARGSNEHQMTNTTRTTLLTHLFALCLKVDNYATDTSIIAHDLSISVLNVNQLFKSLGCKIAILNAQELSRLGLPQSAAASKRAILSAPVDFPKSRVGKKR